MQQILDKGSALYDFDPDIVIVFIDKRIYSDRIIIPMGSFRRKNGRR